MARAAQLVGILVRLETCPAEDGASWLLRLDGTGRIPVSRIGGLVLIGHLVLTPDRVLLGFRSEYSTLIDTSAQVCLFPQVSKRMSLLRLAYTGPPCCAVPTTSRWKVSQLPRLRFSSISVKCFRACLNALPL